MWQILKTRELSALNWRKQAPFKGYVLDFVSHPARLVVEADGGQHNQADQIRHDQQRTAVFEVEGYRVLRFWNNDILTNADGVFRIVLDAASLSPAAARMGRWKAAHKAAVAAQVANLPLDGGGGERMRDGGGDRTDLSDLPLEARPQTAERTPPQAPSDRLGRSDLVTLAISGKPDIAATSPIEGEVRVQPSKSR